MNNCPISPLSFGDGVTMTKHPSQTLAKTTNNQAKHQTATPEPHFLPGYTGHTPGCHGLGQTYGHCNGEALRNHRVAGGRLGRVPGGVSLEVARQQNPHQTPEPHFLPGYTGFVPGSGIRRAEVVGQTYGKMTHVLLSRHDLAGARLRPVHDYPAVLEDEDVEFYCYEHELTRDDVRRFRDQVPGYTGHVPRAFLRHGKNKTSIAVRAIAEFQKMMDG